MVTLIPTAAIVWLDAPGKPAGGGDDGRGGAQHIGGKAAPLCRLAAAGLPVPPGFVITPDAFPADPPADGGPADGIKAPELAPEIQDQVRAAYTELARRLNEQPSTGAAGAQGVRGWSGGAEPLVAVRSSATAEDLADASFAGQYETFLGVRGAEEVIRAAARCWASLWAPHAVAYRAHAEEKAPAAGRSLPSPAMAVLVQVLIPAESAGVAFTADPVSGDRAAVTINAAWGLGQSVVDGEVEADSWTIDRHTRETLTQTTGHKPTRTGLGPDATRVPVPDELKDRPCLTPEQAAAVVALALRAEEQIGGPADVEWAIEGQTLWLLQARPITTGVAVAAPAPAAEPEKLPPGPSGPTPSFPFSWAEAVAQGVAEPAGQSWRHQPRSSESSGVTSALRPLRVDTTLAFWRSFTNSATIKGQERIGRAIILNGQLYTAQVPAPGTEAERAARKAAFERPANALVERGETYLQTVVFPEVDEANARLGAVDPFTPPPSELVAHLEECLRWYERAWTLHWLWGADSPGARFTKLYAELTGATLGEDGKPTEETRNAAAELLTHEPNLFTEAVDGLMALARIAQRHLGVRDVLMMKPAAEALAVLRDPTSPDAPEGADEFHAAFDDLLAKQGLRCGSGFGTETDEMPPSWKEDPTVVIELVKRYAAQDLDAVEAARAGAIAARDKRVAELRAAIVDPEKLAQFDFWLDAARRAQRGFEDHNYKIDSAAGSHLHLAITACARRLVEANLLDDEDDVWWLRLQDVTAALQGLLPSGGDAGATSPDWRALVAGRRAVHRWHESLTPPKTLGAPAPEEKTEEKKPEPAAAPSAAKPAPPPNVLVTGQTGSAGVATGRVRLASKNALVPDVEPSDVLVAHNAGPLWTPVFPTVAAVVLDEGVLFQHAMLTCREYGVPAIFQTKEGSKLLKEGQRVTVDATNGWVLPDE